MDLVNTQTNNFRVKLDDKKPPATPAPAVAPPTTMKFTQAVELREKKAEEERKRSEELKQEEKRRKERQREMAPGVRSRIPDVRDKQVESEEELQRKREGFRRQGADWERKKREIAENVVRRTLLMDQTGFHRSSEVLRLEALAKTFAAVQEVNELEADSQDKP